MLKSSSDLGLAYLDFLWTPLGNCLLLAMAKVCYHLQGISIYYYRTWFLFPILDIHLLPVIMSLIDHVWS